MHPIPERGTNGFARRVPSSRGVPELGYTADAYREQAGLCLSTVYWNPAHLDALQTTLGYKHDDNDKLLAQFSENPVDIITAARTTLEDVQRGSGPLTVEHFAKPGTQATSYFEEWQSEMRKSLGGYCTWLHSLPAGHITTQLIGLEDESSVQWRVTVEQKNGQVVAGPLERGVVGFTADEEDTTIVVPNRDPNEPLFLHWQVEVAQDTESPSSPGSPASPGPTSPGKVACYAVRVALAGIPPGKPTVLGDARTGLLPFYRYLPEYPVDDVPIFYPATKEFIPAQNEACNQVQVNVLVTLRWRIPDPSAHYPPRPLAPVSGSREAEFLRLVAQLQASFRASPAYLQPGVQGLAAPVAEASAGAKKVLQRQAAGLQRQSVLDGDRETWRLLSTYSTSLDKILRELHAMGVMPGGPALNALLNWGLLNGIRPLLLAAALLRDLTAPATLPDVLPVGYLAAVLQLDEWLRQQVGQKGHSLREEKVLKEVDKQLRDSCLHLVRDEAPDGTVSTCYTRIQPQDASSQRALAMLLRRLCGWCQSEFRRASDARSQQLMAHLEPVAIKTAVTAKVRAVLQDLAAGVAAAWEAFQQDHAADLQFMKAVGASGGDEVGAKFQEELQGWTKERYKQLAATTKALLGPECGTWPYRLYEEDVLNRLQASITAVNSRLVAEGMAEQPLASSASNQEKLGEALSELLSQQYSTSSAASTAAAARQRSALSDQHPRHYLVTIETTDVPRATTEANVYVRITGHRPRGELVCSGTRYLPKPAGMKESFIRNKKRELELQLPYLGQVAEVVVGHDATGQAPEWHLQRLIIKDTVSQEVWYFDCNAWLGGGEPLERTLLPYNEDPTAQEVTYQVKVQTGVEQNAGTKEKVYVDLVGRFGSTGPRLLRFDGGHHLQRGGLDGCDVKARDVGEIWAVEVWHDNQYNDAWKLECLWVTDPDTAHQHVFPANKWLSGKSGLKHKLEALPAAETMEYRIEVKTANDDGAGTRERVMVELVGPGEQGPEGARVSTGPLALVQEDVGGAEHRSFSRGQCDLFPVRHRRLGKVEEVRVWLEKRHSTDTSKALMKKLTGGDAWKADYIEVHEVALGRAYRFASRQWQRSKEQPLSLKDPECVSKKMAPQKKYTVTVVTANVSHGGTKARPFLELEGMRGDQVVRSGRKVLRRQDGQSGFGRGERDKITFSCDDLGNITKIVIGHNNKGRMGSPDSWAVQSVEIEDAEDPGRRWAAVMDPRCTYINSAPYWIERRCGPVDAVGQLGAPSACGRGLVKQETMTRSRVALLDWAAEMEVHLCRELRTIGVSTPHALNLLLNRYPANGWWAKVNRRCVDPGGPDVMRPEVPGLVDQGLDNLKATILCVETLVASLGQSSGGPSRHQRQPQVLTLEQQQMAGHLVRTCVAYSARTLLHHVAQACITAIEQGPPHASERGALPAVPNPLLSGSQLEDVAVVDWWVEVGARLNTLYMLDASLHSCLGTEEGSSHIRSLIQAEARPLLAGYVERVEAALRVRMQAAWGGLLGALLRLQFEEDLMELASTHIKQLLEGVHSLLLQRRVLPRVLPLLVQAAAAAGKKLLLGLDRQCQGFAQDRQFPAFKVVNLKRVFTGLWAQLPPAVKNADGSQEWDWDWLTAGHLGEIAEVAGGRSSCTEAFEKLKNEHFELLKLLNTRRGAEVEEVPRPFLGDDFLGGWGEGTSQSLTLLDRVRLLTSPRQLDTSVRQQVMAWLQHPNNSSQVIFGLPSYPAVTNPPFPFVGSLSPRRSPASYATATDNPPVAGTLLFYGSYLVATTLFGSDLQQPPAGDAVQVSDQTAVWDLQQDHVLHAEPDPRGPAGVILDLPHGRMILLNVPLHREAFLKEFKRARGHY